MTATQRLLSSYARTGSESAFREIVTRYIDLVYSTAFRLVGDAQMSEDVTQSVLLALAQKAKTLPPDLMLGGWLHQHTRFVAGQLLRTERRRRIRERQAAEMSALEEQSAGNSAEVAPMLDEAIGELEVSDRTAILLRFFERKDFRGVGEAMGSSEDAARKRVDRALGKLHALLTERGATLSAAALGTVLTTGVVTAAPAGLAATVAGATLASAAAGTGMAAPLLNLLTAAKARIVLAGVVLAAGLATPLVIQHRSQVKLREENQLLREQVGQLTQISAENRRLSNLLAQANTSPALGQDQMRDLLRLRNEVGLLRQQTNHAARLEAENRLLRRLAQPQAADRGNTSELSAREICINNRVAGRIALPAPTPPSKRVRTRRFRSD
jgi:RNA polymerase sigma factor (sigma-70 family)